MTDSTMNASPGHLYLIDGSGFIFRAYHALPQMTRADGTPINAVLGFSNMLFKLLQDLDDNQQPSHLACIFDRSRQTFRNDIYPDYKAHRPPAPDDLVPQFPLIRDAVAAFNVPAIDSDGFEADDIIATYARTAESLGFQVTIVSSDKDLMQLVSDRINMFDSMKNRYIDTAGVFEKFGVAPDKVVAVQALAGDSSDNVPGVPGIGIKTAAQLIDTYGDLDNLLEKAGEIKQPKRRQSLIDHADMARISRQLVSLRTDVEGLPDINRLTVQPIEAAVILPFLEEQGFRNLQAKLLSHMGADAPAAFAESAVIAPDTVEYETVTTQKALDQWLARIKEARQVTMDTETTGLDPMVARLVGISLSVVPGQACYIPLTHGAPLSGELDLGGDAAPDQLSVDVALAALKPVLENPAILKIGQNIKYDYLVLANLGLDMHPLDDTMLMSYALDAGRHHHGMDELARLHLDHKCIPFKEVCGSGKSQITFDQVPLDKATDYAAEDADITGRLHRLLKPRLVDEGLRTVYETIDRPLIPVIARMEQDGILVDRAMLHHLSHDFAGRLAVLEQEIHTLANQKFNIASPKQLGEILFETLGLPGGKKNKSGGYGTNVDVLEKLAAEGHDLPARVLDWRQLAKLKSTYTDALQDQINPDTGRIHTSYALAATTTGRLSSNDPNLQNIPIRTREGRKIRQAFIPKPGHLFLAADYSQIELRLLAHIADLSSLKQAFADGIDIHALTASEVFGIPIKDMDPLIRRQAKAINFGIIYGISAFGLARQLGIGNGEAKAFIETYFKRFPGIRHYMEETKEFCRKHGYVETIFGRRCHIANINDRNGMQRAFGERAAINAPIQGAAADIIRRAMGRMPGALKESGLAARMLLQVHDELVFEVPADEIAATIPLVKQIMEAASLPATRITVPLTVDCGTGKNWEEAH